MYTKFIMNFNKRELINHEQRADYLYPIVLWIKRLLNKSPIITFGSVNAEISVSEIYLSNIYHYLKRTSGYFYNQPMLENNISSTILHESLHVALERVGYNTEKITQFSTRKILSDIHDWDS